MKMEEARAMVAEMDKHTKKALIDTIDRDGSWDRELFINKYLIECGLIPNTKTDNDGK